MAPLHAPSLTRTFEALLLALLLLAGLPSVAEGSPDAHTTRVAIGTVGGGVG